MKLCFVYSIGECSETPSKDMSMACNFKKPFIRLCFPRYMLDVKWRLHAHKALCVYYNAYNHAIRRLCNA